MTVISKTTAGLGLVSCLTDIHKTALIRARNQGYVTRTDAFVSNIKNSMELNDLSYKNNARKNWLAENNFFAGTKTAIGTAKGYIKGVAEGLVRYAPNLLLSGVAMFAKGKRKANIAAIGVAGLEAADFLNNVLNVGKPNNTTL